MSWRDLEPPVLVAEAAEQMVGAVGDDDAVWIRVRQLGDVRQVDDDRHRSRAVVRDSEWPLGVHAGHHTAGVSGKRRRDPYGVWIALRLRHGNDDARSDIENRDEQKEPPLLTQHFFPSLGVELTRDLGCVSGSPRRPPRNWLIVA